MGCACAKFHRRHSGKVGQSPEKEELTQLTVDQIAVIKNNWKKMKLDVAAIGSMVFVR